MPGSTPHPRATQSCPPSPHLDLATLVHKLGVSRIEGTAQLSSNPDIFLAGSARLRKATRLFVNTQSDFSQAWPQISILPLSAVSSGSGFLRVSLSPTLQHGDHTTYFGWLGAHAHKALGLRPLWGSGAGLQTHYALPLHPHFSSCLE